MPKQPAAVSTLFDNPQAIELPPDPHPFVAAWIERDRQVEADAREKGHFAWPKREDTYMGRRELRISDALCKAAEAKGYGLMRPNGQLAPVSFGIKDRRVTWTLEAQTSPRRIPLPKKELRKPDNVARGITTETIRVPTGTFKFIVQIDSGWRKSQISERIHKPFERRIEEVLGRFEKLVDEVIAGEIRSAEFHRQFMEEKRAVERPRRLRVMEEARWDRLQAQTRNWQQAKSLRTFIDTVESTLGSAPRSGREAAWLAWARKRADRLDPLLRGSVSARGVTRWRYDPDPDEYEIEPWELD